MYNVIYLQNVILLYHTDFKLTTSTCKKMDKSQDSIAWKKQIVEESLH